MSEEEFSLEHQDVGSVVGNIELGNKSYRISQTYQLVWDGEVTVADLISCSIAILGRNPKTILSVASGIQTMVRPFQYLGYSLPKKIMEVFIDSNAFAHFPHDIIQPSQLCERCQAGCILRRHSQN